MGITVQQMTIWFQNRRARDGAIKDVRGDSPSDKDVRGEKTGQIQEAIRDFQQRVAQGAARRRNDAAVSCAVAPAAECYNVD